MRCPPPEPASPAAPGRHRRDAPGLPVRQGAGQPLAQLPAFGLAAIKPGTQIPNSLGLLRHEPVTFRQRVTGRSRNIVPLCLPAEG